MDVAAKPLWRPHLAGALLGLTLLAAFLLTGHGLGASGFTTALAAKTAQAVASNAEGNAYFGPMLEDGANPLDSWITWQVLGVALGALIGALGARRFKFGIDGPPRLARTTRLGLAFAGGIIAGIGARISLGCTSGLGLSGAATLATAGFIFLIGFFASGAALGMLMRGLWR